MNKAVLGFLILMFFFNTEGMTQSKKESHTLKSLIKRGWVSLKAVAAGGYNKKALVLHLKNNTGNPISFQVDPALIFEPNGNTKMQPLITTGSEIINLNSNQELQSEVYAFCGNSF